MGNQKTGISMHWTAGTYFPNGLELAHYHGGVSWDGHVARYGKWNDYTANLPHTWGRNSELIGLTACAMAGANTANFGRYPAREEQIEELCLACAEVAYLKKIQVTDIRTHAEWALLDGYGPQSGDPETRWDLAILKSGACTPAIARKTGDYLRGKIGWYLNRLNGKIITVRDFHFENRSSGVVSP